MSSFKGVIGAFINGEFSGSNDLASAVAKINRSFEKTFTPGTGNGQADILFADTRTLSASGSEDLDLAGGVADALGVTRTFAKVVAILIRAAEGNTNNVVVGNAASNEFGGPLSADATVTLPPGGVLALVHPGAGWTVTASTGDLLKLANSSSGSSVSFDIVVVGKSA